MVARKKVLPSGVSMVQLLILMMASGTPLVLHAADTDSLPKGAVAFFDRAACPDGWVVFDDAAGRFVIGITADGGATNGLTVGTALTSGQVPAHNHPFSAGFDTKKTNFALLGGSRDLAKKKTYSFSGETTNSNGGDEALQPSPVELPYYQLLVCQKTADPEGATSTVQQNMIFYQSTATCPNGFTDSPLADYDGRFQVGNPSGGTTGQVFGGAPLANGQVFQHQHMISGSVKLVTKGIAGVTGCCTDGFAKSKTYDYSGLATPVDATPPYIQLLQCTRTTSQ